MKAIVYYHYGSPDVLQFEEIEKPVPQDNEILIKVRAASVNPLDRGELKGVPYIFRIVLGLRKPEVTQLGRPGVDRAGQVEAVGRNVTQFEPGDQVFPRFDRIGIESIKHLFGKRRQRPAHRKPDRSYLFGATPCWPALVPLPSSFNAGIPAPGDGTGSIWE